MSTKTERSEGLSQASTPCNDSDLSQPGSKAPKALKEVYPVVKDLVNLGQVPDTQVFALSIRRTADVLNQAILGKVGSQKVLDTGLPDILLNVLMSPGFFLAHQVRALQLVQCESHRRAV